MCITKADRVSFERKKIGYETSVALEGLDKNGQNPSN
jgi:hypothetical protein